MTTNQEVFGDMFEEFRKTNQDKNGKVFGYILGFREIVGSCEVYAWVQRGVSKSNGEFKNYGPVQRSIKFNNIESARAWQNYEFIKRSEK